MVIQMTVSTYVGVIGVEPDKNIKSFKTNFDIEGQSIWKETKQLWLC